MDIETRRGIVYLEIDSYTNETEKEKKMGKKDFAWALAMLKEGKRVTRTGWNGKGLWIALRNPDLRTIMTLPYIYMHTVQGDLVPWLASQTDLLSDDWEEVEDDS